MINKNTLKNLPLLALLTAGLVLSPTMVMAGHGDNSHSKGQYSRNDRQSHSKGHKQNVKKHYKSHGKSHKGNYGISSKRHYSKGYGHSNDYKRGHYNYRHDHHRDQHHTTYIVNDHHYDDYSYGLDPLRFMIGLHTNNVDIIFRD
jgi:hypothetical protein